MKTEELIKDILELPREEQKRIVRAIHLGRKAEPTNPLAAACYKAAEEVLGVPVGYGRRDRLQVTARTLAVHTFTEEGHTIQEIAQALGIGRSNVYSHLNRLETWRKYPSYGKEKALLQEYDNKLKTLR